MPCANEASVRDEIARREPRARESVRMEGGIGDARNGFHAAAVLAQRI